MTNYTNKIGNPPIHIELNKVPTSDLTPRKDKDLDLTGKTNNVWQKWFNQIKDELNNNNYYGYPSVLLNSDFYWNNGVPTPVTQGDPDGTFFSEKWQVHGSSVATYELKQSPFVNNDSDQIGSTTYIHVDVFSYTTGDFYLYQRQTGTEFLRRYQNRNIPFSILVNNNVTTLKVKLEIYFSLNPGSVTYSQGVIFLNPGDTETACVIKTNQLSPTVIGNSAYVEFRMRFVDLLNNPADFDLIYLKAELADQASILYVDHALERSRIDNS